MPKISVIIPNYNHAPYLKRRIDCVLNQTFTDFEVILLDDNSTDASREVLLSYQDHPKVSHVVINRENSGSPFQQWHRGFELAKGEYIWIAESDDWCEPTLLETLVEPMLRDDSIVLSYCQTLVINLEEEIIYKTRYPAFSGVIDGKHFISTSMFGDCSLINSGMVVFSKQVLKQVDDLYLRFKSAGDWMLWVQICTQGNVFVSGKYLNYFTRHEKTVSSKSVTTGQDYKEGCLIYKWIEKEISPAETEKTKALKLRLAIFYQQNPFFSDKNVRKDALCEFLSLSDKSRYLYWKKQMKRSLNLIINRK